MKWLTEAIAHRIDRRFTSGPDPVKAISTLAASERLCSANPPLLLDVRTLAEFEISHIEGAHYVESAPHVNQLLANLQPTSVIVYCSLGWRSGLVAQGLMERGFTAVIYNLHAGIFGWVQAGLPVFKQSEKTQYVHGYCSPWKYLLPRVHRPK